MWNILGSEFSSGIDFMRVTKSTLHSYRLRWQIELTFSFYPSWLIFICSLSKSTVPKPRLAAICR